MSACPKCGSKDRGVRLCVTGLDPPKVGHVVVEHGFEVACTECASSWHDQQVGDHKRDGEAAASPSTTSQHIDREERVEAWARDFHEVYQDEAKRQGDVRHHDDYDELPENIKEFDRVLARYVMDSLDALERELADLREAGTNFSLRRMHEAEAAARRLQAENEALRQERDQAIAEIEAWVIGDRCQHPGLEAERDRMREALEREWRSNHAEHCTNMLEDHPDPADCNWPRPEVLRQALQEEGP